MHVKALKVFCDIVRWRNFSRAADENRMSQSGASQIVHQIEERLDVQLIDRSKRPIAVTEAGKVYYEGCRRLVGQFERLEEEVRTLHRETLGTVKVASIYSVGLSHMNQFVQQFMQCYPKASVRLQYEHPERVYELVELEVCDLGVVSFPKSTRQLEAVAWRDEPMMLVCSPSNDLARKPQVTLADLERASLVAFDTELLIRRETDRVLQGRETKVAMEFDNIETIKRAVEIDAGVSLLPAPTVMREIQLGTLAAVPLADIEFTRPVGVVFRRGLELGRTTQRFLKLLLGTDASPISPAGESERDTPSLATAASASEPVDAAK